MSALALRDVHVRRGGRSLLANVSLDVAPGEIVGLVGPNGAGKSTLLRVAAGLLAPCSGSVALFGTAADRCPPAGLARLRGYLPQQLAPAWDFRAREILEIARSGAPQPPDPVAPGAALGELQERRWSELSGGERARVLLAAAVVNDPPLLLADEPGASLDVRHRLELLAELARAPRRRAVLVVLHDLDLAVRWCDRIAVLDAGRLALCGAARDVALDGRLDTIFGVRFARLPVDGESGPLLPIPRAAAPRRARDVAIDGADTGG